MDGWVEAEIDGWMNGWNDRWVGGEMGGWGWVTECWCGRLHGWHATFTLDVKATSKSHTVGYSPISLGWQLVLGKHRLPRRLSGDWFKRQLDFGILCLERGEVQTGAIRTYGPGNQKYNFLPVPATTWGQEGCIESQPMSSVFSPLLASS